MWRKCLIIKGLLLLGGVYLLIPDLSFSLTIADAIIIAKKKFPSYKASVIKVRSSESLYKASLSPFLPTLGISGAQEHLDRSSDAYDLSNYNASLAYTLFDGGRRKANRNIARLNLESDQEETRKNLMNLEFNVKVMYYKAMAKKELLEQRNLQLKDAQKDYEIAKARHKFGLALRSDVLQSLVRHKQALFDLRKAKGDLAQSLYDLNSLLGRRMDTLYDLQDNVNLKVDLPDKEKLVQIAFGRPAAQQALYLVEISENNQAVSESEFYPSFYFDLSYDNLESYKEYSDFSSENKTAAITAKWNIFEFGKYYRKKSFKFETGVFLEKLNDVKRLISLEVYKSCEEYLTSLESLSLADQQLAAAQFNYNQAVGEYKSGKGDILSLIQAESLLSEARNQVSASWLELAVSKAAVERAAGVRDLESMQKVSLP